MESFDTFINSMDARCENGKWVVGTVQLVNNSNVISFFNEITLVIDKNKTVLPVIWSDNYISLLPKEEKVLHVKVLKCSLDDKEPKIVFNTINSSVE